MKCFSLPPCSPGLAVGLAVVLATGAGANLRAEAKAATPSELADLSLEQLMELRIDKVVSASRYEQRVTEAPAAVSIVSAPEMERFGHRTLSDVLRSVRGFYASNDANFSYLGVRGFLRPGDFDTRVLILVDGHRMNDTVYDAGSIGRENALDLDLVERVEVVRGPSSSVYGSSAFFGVVNVVTKRGAQIGGGVVSAEAGNLGTFKARTTVGGVTRSGIDWMFSASRYASDGRKTIYYPEFDPRVSTNPAAAHDGVAENRDGETAETLFGRGSWKDLTLTASFTRRNKEVPTASYGTIFNDPRFETTDQRAYVDLKYDGALSPDLRLLGRVFYDSYRYYGDYPFDYALSGRPADAVLNKDYGIGEWAGAEMQLSARFGRHRVVAGAEFRDNFREDQLNYDVEPWAEYTRVKETSQTLGVFLQGEISLTRQLMLNVGVRRDHYFKNLGATTNPRVGLIHRLSPRTTVKALYGQAFRAPNTYERNFYVDQRSLPALQPEKIRTSELVLEQYLSKNYSLTLSGYHYDVSALISQSTFPATDGLVFRNIDGAHSTGAEIELLGRWAGGASARTSYAYQQATDRATGAALSSSPRSLAKLNLILPLSREQAFLGYELLYRSTARTLAGNTVPENLQSNVTLTLPHLFGHWDAAISAYNAGKSTGYFPGGEDHTQDMLPQEGRTFRLKLAYRF